MTTIRVLIIDDERAAREELKRLLASYPDVAIIGEAVNADEAKEKIEHLHPDLIFLDIKMPEKSGFDLLESLDEVPAVLFTTAYDQYAVQAFELNALDYLMKPIRIERFAKAMEKVKKHLGTVGSPYRQLFIKDGECCYFIRTNDLYLIESLENYTRLYFQDKKVVLKRSLRQWEQLLDASFFFRINRTQLINTSYIQHIQTAPNNRLTLQLTTGQELEVSSRQSVKFKNSNGI